MEPEHGLLEDRRVSSTHRGGFRAGLHQSIPDAGHAVASSGSSNADFASSLRRGWGEVFCFVGAASSDTVGIDCDSG